MFTPQGYWTELVGSEPLAVTPVLASEATMSAGQNHVVNYIEACRRFAHPHTPRHTHRHTLTHTHTHTHTHTRTHTHIHTHTHTHTHTNTHTHHKIIIIII